MENNSFTILPMSQRFILEPGKTYTGKITVVNPVDATNDFLYKASITPFNVIDDNYTVDLTTPYNRSALANWITIKEPSGRVAPNESKDVEFTIVVPTDAPAGGQYATISVASDSDVQSSSGVAVQNVFEMASIIYAQVAGETVHEGKILENKVPGFSAVTPVTISAVISNEGNVHEDATFVIKVKDKFSGRDILPTEDDDGMYNELIMPESTKNVERNISNLPSIGVFRVTQMIYYNGDFSQVEKDVIVCPIWFIGLVVLTIAAIITSIVMSIRRHRRKRLSV